MCGCLLCALHWPTTQVCALTGYQTSDPLIHRPALNPVSHNSQGCLVLFWQHLYKSIQDMGGRVILSQSTRGKNPPNIDSTTTKSQLQPERTHKYHKGHLKSFKLRSRRLHHQVQQVSDHTRSHHEDRESKQIYLILRNKQRETGKMKIQRNNLQTMEKEETQKQVELRQANYRTQISN